MNSLVTPPCLYMSQNHDNLFDKVTHWNWGLPAFTSFKLYVLLNPIFKPTCPVGMPILYHWIWETLGSKLLINSCMLTLISWSRRVLNVNILMPYTFWTLHVSLLCGEFIWPLQAFKQVPNSMSAAYLIKFPRMPAVGLVSLHVFETQSNPRQISGGQCFYAFWLKFLLVLSQ
jgi:hypothetical protein